MWHLMPAMPQHDPIFPGLPDPLSPAGGYGGAILLVQTSFRLHVRGTLAKRHGEGLHSPWHACGPRERPCCRLPGNGDTSGDT